MLAVYSTQCCLTTYLGCLRTLTLLQGLQSALDLVILQNVQKYRKETAEKRQEI